MKRALMLGFIFYSSMAFAGNLTDLNYMLIGPKFSLGDNGSVHYDTSIWKTNSSNTATVFEFKDSVREIRNEINKTEDGRLTRIFSSEDATNYQHRWIAELDGRDITIVTECGTGFQAPYCSTANRRICETLKLQFPKGIEAIEKCKGMLAAVKMSKEEEEVSKGHMKTLTAEQSRLISVRVANWQNIDGLAHLYYMCDRVAFAETKPGSVKEAKVIR